MFAELVILLGLANIVLVYLIMRKLKEISYPTSTRKKKAEEEEEDEEEDDEKEDGKKEKDEVKEAKEKLARMEEEEAKEKSSKKPKSKLGRFFGKKEEKAKPHLSEMPDMNRVIEELQAEFANRAAEAAPVSRKKTGNEIEERLDEIERM